MEAIDDAKCQSQELISAVISSLLKIALLKPSIICVLLVLIATHGSSRAAEVSFVDALKLAWKRDPVRIDLLANKHSAAARADAAQSLFPSGPILSGDYYSDKYVGSHQGYATWQGAISVPLWLPGQSEATVQVAQTESEALQERLHVEHMSLAVKLLDIAGTVFLAQRKQEFAGDQLSTIKSLARTIAKKVQAGEAPSTDQNAIDAEVATADTQLKMADEEKIVALASLSEILGGPQVPDLGSYNLRTLRQSQIKGTHLQPDQDPRVLAAHLSVINARDRLHLAEKSFMPNPQIGIAAIRDIQFGSPWDTRTAITFNMALPSDAQNVPLKTAAIDKLTAAEKEEQLVRRMVRIEYARVTARQKAAAATLTNTKTAVAALTKRADDIENSWKLNESSLIEVLRAHQSAFNAKLALAQAEVELHASVIRFFISAGRI